MRTIKKTFPKGRISTILVFQTTSVKLHSENSSLSIATFWSAAGKMRKVKETFARCVRLKKFRKYGYQQYWF